MDQLLCGFWSELQFLLVVALLKIDHPILELLLDLFIGDVVNALLYVIQCNTLFVHYFHVEVCWVAPHWNWEPDLFEIPDRILATSLINEVSLDHNNQLVKGCEDF